MRDTIKSHAIMHAQHILSHLSHLMFSEDMALSRESELQSKVLEAHI
jgi:hypothetical protein